MYYCQCLLRDNHSLSRDTWWHHDGVQEVSVSRFYNKLRRNAFINFVSMTVIIYLSCDTDSNIFRHVYDTLFFFIGIVTLSCSWCPRKFWRESLLRELLQENVVSVSTLELRIFFSIFRSSNTRIIFETFLFESMLCSSYETRHIRA